jgi:hypothetical protein
VGAPLHRSRQRINNSRQLRGLENQLDLFRIPSGNLVFCLSGKSSKTAFIRLDLPDPSRKEILKGEAAILIDILWWTLKRDWENGRYAVVET